MELGNGPREFNSYTHGPILADRVIYDDSAESYLTRFLLRNVGRTATRLPRINVLSVMGIVDNNDEWVAPFPKPTAQDPEVIF